MSVSPNISQVGDGNETGWISGTRGSNQRSSNIFQNHQDAALAEWIDRIQNLRALNFRDKRKVAQGRKEILVLAKALL